MKQSLFAALILCISSTAFAGKGFRPIHFTVYFTEQSPGLSAPIGSPQITGPSNRVEGDIIINTEDSSLQITSAGTTSGNYKITSIEQESDDTYRHINEQELHIKDAAGKAYRVSIQRRKELKSMKVLFIPDGGAYGAPYVVYECDYLKKLQ